MLRLLPGISSSLISTLPVHSPAFFPKPLPVFFHFLPVLHCPLGPAELQACPFPDVFPPLPLSALSSSPFHCALQELRTQKLKSHLVRTQSLNVLPLKSGVGQNIAIHATLTARNFFLAYFYPSGPFTCIFSKTSHNFFLCWLWLSPDPV